MGSMSSVGQSLNKRANWVFLGGREEGTLPKVSSKTISVPVLQFEDLSWLPMFPQHCTWECEDLRWYHPCFRLRFIPSSENLSLWRSQKNSGHMGLYSKQNTWDERQVTSWYFPPPTSHSLTWKALLAQGLTIGYLLQRLSASLISWEQGLFISSQNLEPVVKCWQSWLQ